MKDSTRKIINNLQDILIVMSVLILISSCSSIGSERVATNVLEGSYLTEQAQRGRGVFTEICRQCHIPRDFRAILRQDGDVNAIISDYFQLISLTMPQDSPGSLSRETYLDIMAYFMSLNGIAAADKKEE